MRTLAWFSCGAASAVAAKLAVEKYGSDCLVVYCDTSRNEHPDNKRFMADVELWLGRTVTRLYSKKYKDVDDVIARTKYMAGIQGARCTAELKKVPRFEFQHPDDTHVFGFTSDEGSRIERFEVNNPELTCDWILQTNDISKADCLAMIRAAGIELPRMYQLGYANNNCLGCVKATSAKYWNNIRRDFPDVFEKRARQSRELGVRLTRIKGKRVFLDELPDNYFVGGVENISCGPECGTDAS